MAMISMRAIFESNFCNAWPEIEIVVNGRMVWHGFVEQQALVEIEFPSQDTNTVLIKYLNKRNGPTVWDTQVDDQGKIIQDQNCILQELYINRCRCDWLIPKIPYYLDDGSVQSTFGFMAFRGHMMLQIPGDVYQWILDQRGQDQQISSLHTSSLDYKNVYLPRHDAGRTQSLINNIKATLDAWNDTQPGH